MKTMSQSLLNYPRTKNIVQDKGCTDNSTKLLLLSDKIKDISALSVRTNSEKSTI